MSSRVRVHLSTSGYSYRFWHGKFYPQDLPGWERLSFYARYFTLTELNFSFYRIPSPSTMRSLRRQAGDGFTFSLKLWRGFTHRRSRPPSEEEIEAFLKACHALGDGLRFILAQFAHAYTPGEAEVERIWQIAETFSPWQVVVELRHREWLEEGWLDRLPTQVVVAALDLPELADYLPPVIPRPGPLLYLRLHGRNREAWTQGGAGKYDYAYKPDELSHWVELMDQMEELREAFIFANNTPCALEAVESLRELLSEKPRYELISPRQPLPLGEEG